MQFTGHSLPVHQFVTVPWVNILHEDTFFFPSKVDVRRQ